MPAHTRICAEPGCPELTSRTRCTDHDRAREHQRGTTSERGYGTEHQHTRQALANLMRQGQLFICPACTEPVDPNEPWDLGHTADRNGYLGPMHTHCNRATARRAA